MEDNSINIYPNPSDNELFVDLAKSSLNLKLIEIIDLNGKILLSQQISTDTFVKLNTSNLVQGMYQIRFTSDNQPFSKRFIKN